MIPAKGFQFGDASNMIDPHKIGGVMWSRVPSGELVPLDLHGAISVRDIRNLNSVVERLQWHRKIGPALQVIVNATWDDMAKIKPYLIATMKGRSEARSMIASGDWESFWSVIN